LSGIDAVKKIVETEGQARRIVDEAATRGQKITSEAREQAERIRQEAIARAQQQREEILSEAKDRAEGEALQSDEETEHLLDTYRKLSEERKAAAVNKAVELILNA
jgi:vacuolar-type H+-ATPase subunit H